MSKGVPLKVAVVTMLVGTALIRNGVPTVVFAIGRLVLGILAIGIFNVVVSPPGTLWVRGFGVVCSFIGLLFPDGPRAVAVVLLWLVWPPAYLVAWSLESARFEAELEPPSDAAPIRRAGHSRRDYCGRVPRLPCIQGDLRASAAADRCPVRRHPYAPGHRRRVAVSRLARPKVWRAKPSRSVCSCRSSS